jgi:ribonuclease T2
MIKSYLVAFALAAAAPAASAQDFDYYLLALTWTPSFCAAEGDARDRAQCDEGRDLGFTLHGLWPQYEEGWPEFCDSAARDPSRRDTAAMADIMGDAGLAWYQWKKHGRCSGLSARDYFDQARFAYALLSLPDPGSEATAAEVEAGFLAANPELDPEDVIVTCRADLLREVRICLDRDLTPRPCGEDVLRAACRDRGLLELPPIR